MPQLASFSPVLALLLVGSLLAGLVTFPILFYFQHKLHLPVPNLEKSSWHIHHSFWGALMSIGGALAFWQGLLKLGILLLGYGLGWLIHHELTEPGWKFIYLQKERKETVVPDTILNQPVNNERPTPAFFSLIMVFGSILLMVVVTALIFILQFSAQLFNWLAQI